MKNFSNNPGDIREANIAYRGKLPTNGSPFMSFDTMANGFRAMFVDIYTYVKKEGKNTLTLIINQYAPRNENDTTAYINDVAAKANFGPDQMIIPASFLPGGPMVDIVRAMAQHENSPSGAWNEADLQAGYQAFLADYQTQIS